MVNSMITITGLGDHDRLEWPITMAGMRSFHFATVFWLIP
jgi:hypothetical protein